MKLSGEFTRVTRIRAHLLKEFHRKKCVYNEDTDRYEVPKGTDEQVVYDQLFFLGKEEMGNLYPNFFRMTLENAMLAEGRMKSGEFIWPREDDFTEVYFKYGKDNRLFAQLSEYAKFDESEWQLEDGPALTRKDKDILAEFKDEFLDLLARLTNAMFLKDKEGERVFYEGGYHGTGKSFLTCENERLRIDECFQTLNEIFCK